jgi:FkbM family methyltransferase
VKPSPFIGLPALAGVLAAADLKLVDVGARRSAMPQLAPLAPFAHYYACEPDREEAGRLAARLPQDLPWRAVTVVTEALASRRGTADLYLTHQPGMSSLLEPDLSVANRYCGGHKFQVTSVARVPTITLNDAAARYGFEDACFLKLDTQGTELDILQSGGPLVGSLLGVYVETLFHPFYKGQALFADVDAYLRGQGFSLFGLYRTLLRRASYRPSLYSRRAVVWAHCVYFREPATLLDGDRSTAARRAARLLGLALAFQYYDLGFEVAEAGVRAGLFDDSRALMNDIESVARQQTRRLARKANADDAEAVLTAPSQRDNRYRE